jgi:hypothetical protein
MELVGARLLKIFGNYDPDVQFQTASLTLEIRPSCRVSFPNLKAGTLFDGV